MQSLASAIFDILFPKRKVGLVLSGGGARGIAHIGVAKILLENKIPIDYIIGTSVGAVIGSLLAAGIPIDEMYRFTQSMSLGQIAKLVIDKRGSVSGEPIERLLSDYIGDKNFDELKIPFAVVTSDLKKGEAVVIKKGSVMKAVRASSAFPGIFTPVEIDGRILFDGAVFANAPIDIAREMGLDTLIVSDAIPRIKDKKEPPHVFEIVDRTVDLLLIEQTKNQSKRNTFIIEPVDGEITSAAVWEGPRLLQMGEAAAKKVIGRLKEELRIK